MAEIRTHIVMRPAVQIDTVERFPMQSLKQHRVAALDIGVEFAGAASMGGPDRELDQRGTQRADAR